MQILIVLLILFAIYRATDAAEIEMRIEGEGVNSKFYYCSRVQPFKANRPHSIKFMSTENPSVVKIFDFDSNMSPAIFDRNKLKFCWELLLNRFYYANMPRGIYEVKYLKSLNEEVKTSGDNPLFVVKEFRARDERAILSYRIGHVLAESSSKLPPGRAKSTYVPPKMPRGYNFDDQIRNLGNLGSDRFANFKFSSTSPSYAETSGFGMIKAPDGHSVSVELVNFHTAAAYPIYFRFTDDHFEILYHVYNLGIVCSARAMGKFALAEFEVKDDPVESSSNRMVDIEEVDTQRLMHSGPVLIEITEGESLFSYMKRENVDVNRAKKIWKDAILEAHANKVLVGDIRSSNIVVDSDGVGHVARYFHSIVLPLSQDLANEKLALEIALLDYLIEAECFVKVEQPDGKLIRRSGKSLYADAIGIATSAAEIVDLIGEWLASPQSNQIYGAWGE